MGISASNWPALERYARMAMSVRGKPNWPGWSTGEMLIVALVLNRHDVLKTMGYTIVEALDRISGDLTIDDLRLIERAIQ